MYQMSKLCIYLTLFVVNVIAKPQSRFSTVNKEIVVNASNNLTLLCEGNEKMTWTYPNNTIDGTQWTNVNVETSESNGKHLAKLILSNASYVDVGYYNCQPENNENAGKGVEEQSTYVYVRDGDHLSALLSYEIVFLITKPDSIVTLPCRPTSPDVSVKLYEINGEEVPAALTKFNKHIGYTMKTNIFDAAYTCSFKRNGIEEELSVIVSVIFDRKYVPKPSIEVANNATTKIRDTFVLNCTVILDQNDYFSLDWMTPNPSAVESQRISISTTSAVIINNSKIGHSTLTIKDAHLEDAGEYACIVTDHTTKSNRTTINITVGI